MFGILIYDLLFWLLPILLLAAFVVSLSRYLSAKEQNHKTPGAISEEEMKRRKVFLIVSSVMAGLFLAVVIGFVALLFMAVAYM